MPNEVSKPHSKPGVPTRMDLIQERLKMNTDRPSGVAWMSAYKLDVQHLVEQYESLRAVAQRVLDEADAECNGTLWPPSENWHDAESDLWRLLNSNPAKRPT